MKLCRVLGNIVATEKHEAFRGERLMIVQPIDPAGTQTEASFLAVDRAQSGPGDRVLVLREGTGIRQIMQAGDKLPIRSLIVGVVDMVDVT